MLVRFVLTSTNGRLAGPDSNRGEIISARTIEIHVCKCPTEGCLQMYSLSLGYFTTKLNDAYGSATGSLSLAVLRNHKGYAANTSVPCSWRNTIKLQSWRDSCVRTTIVSARWTSRLADHRFTG
jgi:hypothetical protein